MSSISFPGQPIGSRSSELSDEQFYTPSYDTSAFQMNPLSSHPPRTPRVSINGSALHSSHMYSSATYEEEKVVEEPPQEDSSEIDEDEDRLKAAEQRLSREEVWREMFLTSYGRDKAFVSVSVLLSSPLADFSGRNSSSTRSACFWYSISGWGPLASSGGQDVRHGTRTLYSDCRRQRRVSLLHGIHSGTTFRNDLDDCTGNVCFSLIGSIH